MLRSLESLRRAVSFYALPLETRSLPPLGYPLRTAPRMVVLGYQIRPTPGVQCLLSWTAAELARFRPAALAASYEELARMAAAVQYGKLTLPELQYPLLVFSRPGDGALTLAQHDQLWAWFGLPCFEQVRDEQGRLLAHECEARDGFHLTEDGRDAPLDGRPLHGPCECGLATPRIRIAPAAALLAQAAAG